jgi:hypothetical protein
MPDDDGGMTSSTDWQAWHGGYDDPGSSLSHRLHVVQAHIDEWLTATAPGQLHVVSVCAGDGRDLLQVLERRGDGHRVSGVLVEADPASADRARGHVRRLGLDRIAVECGDAGTSNAYAGLPPAHLLLLCGVFGNVPDDDVRRTVAALPQLVARDGLVVWTRHRRTPDLTSAIREWLAEDGFEEVAFTAPEDALFGVGVHRFRGQPQPLVEGRRLFTFFR